MSKSAKQRVLVAEMPAIRKMIAVALKRAGFAVECCEPRQAQALLRDERFGVLITNSPADLRADQIATIYLAGDALEFGDRFPAQVQVIAKPFEVERLGSAVQKGLRVNHAPPCRPPGMGPGKESRSLKAGGLKARAEPAY